MQCSDSAADGTDALASDAAHKLACAGAGAGAGGAKARGGAGGRGHEGAAADAQAAAQRLGAAGHRQRLGHHRRRCAAEQRARAGRVGTHHGGLLCVMRTWQCPELGKLWAPCLALYTTMPSEAGPPLCRLERRQWPWRCWEGCVRKSAGGGCRGTVGSGAGSACWWFVWTGPLQAKCASAYSCRGYYYLMSEINLMPESRVVEKCAQRSPSLHAAHAATRWSRVRHVTNSQKSAAAVPRHPESNVLSIIAGTAILLYHQSRPREGLTAPTWPRQSPQQSPESSVLLCPSLLILIQVCASLSSVLAHQINSSRGQPQFDSRQC
jgi:hypothetical protein